MGEQQNWPMEFVDGYVEQMSISVPWSALLKDSSNIEVKGLNITIQPKQRSDNGKLVILPFKREQNKIIQLQELLCLSQCGVP